MSATFTIPETQVAAWVDKPGPDSRLEIKSDIQVPQPKDGEVLVKLECSGVW